jgi:hypothetical protein
MLATAININYDEEQEEARAIILADRRLTIEEITSQLSISQGSAYSLVHDNFGFHKVSARWVPLHMTEEHKSNRLDICSHLLKQYNREGNNSLNRINTGNKTWIYHYEPETKWQNTYNGSTCYLQFQKNSVAALCQKALVDSVLGLPRAYPSTLFGTRYYGNKCKVLQHAKK